MTDSYRDTNRIEKARYTAIPDGTINLANRHILNNLIFCDTERNSEPSNYESEGRMRLGEMRDQD
ncbi:MAG TPA: hypothetical protein VFD48_08130 [Pyrinomonadaceae bacterium]|nr:hypothetical protein [Pyrinomonadaceae bacterium]